MLSIEIVVDGEAAHLEPVGDVFDRLAQGERSELVEPTNHILFAGPVEAGDRGAQFALDLIDQAIERTLEAGGTEAADNGTVPSQRDVTSGEFCRRDDLAAEGQRQRLDRFEELLHVPQASRTSGPLTRGSSHLGCMH